MKNLIKTSLLLSMLAPALSAQAIQLNEDFELSLTAEAVTDYRSRGQSQTLGDPALQGEAVLTHSSGLYGGVWTSNVDFGEGVGARQELDYFAGYNWAITEDVGLDVGVIKYAYEGEASYNYRETYGILSAYGAKLGYQYSDDYAGDQSYSWTYLGYDTTLPHDVALSLRYGIVDYKDDVFFSESGNGNSKYSEWEAKVSKEFYGLNFGLSYIDTNLTRDECASYLGYDDVCNATVVASVSKTF